MSAAASDSLHYELPQLPETVVVDRLPQHALVAGLSQLGSTMVDRRIDPAGAELDQRWTEYQDWHLEQEKERLAQSRLDTLQIAGAALALDLLERIETLKAQLRRG